MAKIVIIGAGLTGISTAYHLEQRGFFDYALFEKEATVGGLCRSIYQDGFTFDYTGHLLHASDPYFQALIVRLVGMEYMNHIHRRSFIYSQNIYSRYPFQINLFGLPEQTIIDCIEGFASREQHPKKIKSFYDWVLSNFGSGIAQHFFFPFQKKIFSYDLHQVTPTWMGRFVPATSLREMISGALHDKTDTLIGYNSQFIYPKDGGINFWITKFANALQKTIHTEFEVERIDLKNKKVYFSNGHCEPFQTLINTMPLDTFLSLAKEPASTSLSRAGKKLVCNSVVNFNLGIQRSNLSSKHWIYFPESQYPFYRIGFPHNFSHTMVPEGCSSLYGEFSHIGKNQEELDVLLKESISQTKKLFAIDPKEIITQKIIYIPRAYVIYDFWREKNLPKIHKRLEEFDVHSIGRYGGWKYSSMQEAVLDGKEIVEKITIVPARHTFYQPETPFSPEKQKELQ